MSRLTYLFKVLSFSLYLFLSAVHAEDDKCTDFTSHVCGPETSQFSLLQTRNQQTLRGITGSIKEALKSKGDNQIQKYLESCMKRDPSRLFIVSKLREIQRLTEIEDKVTEQDVARLLDETSTMDNLLFRSGYDNKNNGVFTIMERTQVSKIEFSKDSTHFDSYRKFLKNFVEHMNWQYDRTIWESVLELEDEIIKHVQGTTMTGSYSLSRGKFYDLSEGAPLPLIEAAKFINRLGVTTGFDFKDFLRAVVDRLLMRDKYITVKFLGVGYFRGLQKIMEKYKPSIVARYVVLKSAMSLYSTLPETMENAAKGFNSKTSFYEPISNSEEYCKMETEEKLEYLRGEIYVQKVFAEKAKKMALELFEMTWENFKKDLEKKKCQALKSSFTEKIGTLADDIFRLPFSVYLKGSTYSDVFFENYLTQMRDAVRNLGSEMIGLNSSMTLWLVNKHEISFYHQHTKELYIMPQVFNFSTEHKSEFMGYAAPHVASALLKVVDKEALASCLLPKGADEDDTEKFFLSRAVMYTQPRFHANYNKDDFGPFYVSFAREFCHENSETRKRLSAVLASTYQFQVAFGCQTNPM